MSASRCLSRCTLAFGLFSLVLIGRDTTIAADHPTCLGQPATIVGSGVVNGTNGDDVIVGSDGDDIINGKGGNDVICGGLGNDTMDGGSGRDTIEDLAGVNVGKGGSGADSVRVTGTADGGTGNDEFVIARETCDGCHDGHASGGSGNDAFVEVTGGVADGGPGNDFLSAGVKAVEQIRDDGEVRREVDSDVEAVEELAEGSSGGEVRRQADSDVETIEAEVLEVEVVEVVAFEENTLDGGTGRDTCAGPSAATSFVSCETIR